MKKRALLVVLLPSLLWGDPKQDLTRAIEYYKAGRKDMAQNIFRNLLRQDLELEERATVLYDLATLLTTISSLSEAEILFDELLSLPIESKILKESALHNFAICALWEAERSLKTVPKNNEEHFSEINQSINFAKKAVSQISNISEQNALLDRLSSVEEEFTRRSFEATLLQMSDDERLSFFINYLKAREDEMLSYLIAQGDLAPYIASMQHDVLYKTGLHLIEPLHDPLEIFIQKMIANEKEQLEKDIKSLNGFGLYEDYISLGSWMRLLLAYFHEEEITELFEQIDEAKGNMQFLPAFWKKRKIDLEKIVAEMIEIDPLRAFQGEVKDLLNKGIQEDKLKVLLATWKEAKLKVDQKQQLQIDSFITLLQDKDSSDLQMLSLMAIQQELVPDKLTEKDELQYIQRAKKFEQKLIEYLDTQPEAAQFKQVEFAVISLHFLEKIEEMHIEIPENEKQQYSRALQEAKRSLSSQINTPTTVATSKSAHKDILIVLEKIDNMLQKQNETKEQSLQKNEYRPEMSSIIQNNQKITAENAIQLLQEMERDDALSQSIPQSSSQKVERPW